MRGERVGMAMVEKVSVLLAGGSVKTVRVPSRRCAVLAWRLLLAAAAGVTCVDLKGVPPMPSETADEVPAPWTPLTIAERSLSCWNRVVEFGVRGFRGTVDRLLGQSPTRVHDGPTAQGQ